VALPDLAAGADLTARGITVTSVHTVMLAVASSVVRQAAGSPILSTSSVVTLWGVDCDQWLTLPGQPVTTVTTVVHDGTTLTANTDYKLVEGRLWGASPWGDGCEPLKVVVTMTHGLAAVPASIVQLVCDLAIAGANAATAGAHSPNVIAEKIDDYSVTFAAGAEAVASAVELPVLTKRALRAQFGGGVSMVSYR
jgi:hypothetical protein